MIKISAEPDPLPVVVSGTTDGDLVTHTEMRYAGRAVPGDGTAEEAAQCTHRHRAPGEALECARGLADSRWPGAEVREARPE